MMPDNETLLAVQIFQVGVKNPSCPAKILKGELRIFIPIISLWIFLCAAITMKTFI